MRFHSMDGLINGLSKLIYWNINTVTNMQWCIKRPFMGTQELEAKVMLMDLCQSVTFFWLSGELNKRAK